MSDTYRKRKYRALKREEHKVSVNNNSDGNTKKKISDYDFEDVMYSNSEVSELSKQSQSTNVDIQQSTGVDYKINSSDSCCEKSPSSRIDHKLDLSDISSEISQSFIIDNKIELSDRSSESDQSSDNSSVSDEEKSVSSNCLQLPESNLNKKVNSRGNMRTKLHVWAIKYRKNLSRSCIEHLLQDLRSEGLPDIPKSLATLIPSDSTKNFDIKVMKSARGKLGSFVYFGVLKALEKIIQPTIYTEKIINIAINVDGMQVFSNSREQLWPILGMVVHEDYISHPFIIALFGGNSKPDSSEEFFEQFVQEMNDIILNGIEIDGTMYIVKLGAFICDTPARAFIKGTKSHIGFCSCERCEVHGVTINKKRVFNEVDSILRTENSFRNKLQEEHHVKDCHLLKLVNFDPVKDVLLDPMHLFFNGFMKFCLERYVSTSKKKGKLKTNEKKILISCLESASGGITFEFQRKKLDIENLQYWKATQYRFVLLYCSGLIFKHILTEDAYQHFMLIFVACRILCSKTMAVKYAEYAKILLKQFVILLPTYFGEDSQTMNNHNIMHSPDDVIKMQKSLSEISAFPFENCLGLLKTLIKGRKDIVPQIIKRISEIDYCPQVAEDDRAVNNIIRKKENTITEEINKFNGEIKSIFLREMKITTSQPDNIVILKNNVFFKVAGIKKHGETFNVEGYTIECAGDSFDYPCKSSKVGIWKLGTENLKKSIFPANDIKNKCVVLKIKEEQHVLILLHIY